MSTAAVPLGDGCCFDSFDELRGHVGETTQATAALLHLGLEVELHGDLGSLLHDGVLVGAAGSAALGRFGVEELDVVV